MANRLHMCWLVVLLLCAALFGCGRTKEGLQAAPTIDEAGVIAMSRALLNAYAQQEGEVFSQALAPAFVMFEDGHVESRAGVLEHVRARKARSAPARALTWREQHVAISDRTAVFVGSASEHTPPEGERGASDLEGWNTLVWSWSGTRWQATFWQWQQAGLQADREMWNAEFRSGTGFTPKPNRLLADFVSKAKPGIALDVAMGQGRNSIHLASLDWAVTGIDISDVGLRIANETAAQRKLKIETINTDMSAWDYGTEKWDLIALIYIRPGDNEFQRMKASLKRGGSFVVEGFHKPRAQNWEAGELAKIFSDGYQIVRDEVALDTPDWSTHPEKIVRFIATKR
jgi:SAM-dependent methyltransferase